MKVLVCMSVVPDTTTKITFTNNDTSFNAQGVQFIMNPYDELALTKALDIAEPAGGTVTILHVGPADAEPVIRKALSMGATDAVRINAVPSDSQFVAAQIAAYAKDKGFDFILTGRESIDYNGGAVCGLLGAMLNIPSISVITQLSVSGQTATIKRDIDGGRETVSCSLPFVASAQKELCEPRIPNMRGIMAARTKPLQVTDPASGTTHVNYVRFELPQPKQGVKMISADNPEELLHLLRNEAKVI
ncbi:MAG: electron transfer flavoprotein subunit beta/FixA family protein [Bacteroidetes bacterium]|nr:electron transfer flavoprotein subunit beta/FixA family protein [Bacteroidota bacterium]